MKLLLIVGSANDIFIYNYAKWLKKSMDVSIDVFEFYPSKQQGYGNENYNSVSSATGYLLPTKKGKGVIDPIVRTHNLSSFLKGKYYDIIHIHWIVAPVVMQGSLKKHCNKLVVTFWGGEMKEQRILYSRLIYRIFLNRLSKQVDGIINSSSGKQQLLKNVPHFQGAFYSASLGSAPLELLYNKMTIETRESSKKKLLMPSDKFIVLIGYSGKSIHRHIPIIKELAKQTILKDRIHILAPMTRGASPCYVSSVENELSTSGLTYTVISNRFLSDDEVATVRNATDVVLQLSEWDGFSRSVLECLCAKSILIYGDWLGYDYFLEPSGFKGIKVNSIEEAVEKLVEILYTFDNYNTMVENNHINGRKQAIWSECIKDWISAYNYILKK
jgi:glycosyltransferase involved in cell wall biosynthesis